MGEIEFWVPVVGYEGLYSVSSLGRVRRESDSKYGGRAGQVLEGSRRTGSYYRVYLYNGSRSSRRCVNVARLMWEAFVGPIPGGMEVDHIDGDETHDRLSNLRLATRSQNICNSSPWGESRFRGVSRQPGGKRWRARIQADGVGCTLGWFDTEVEAAQAYDAAAEELHGEFARLNFP